MSTGGTFELFKSRGGLYSRNVAQKFAKIMLEYGKSHRCKLSMLEILENTPSTQLNSCFLAGGWKCVCSWLTETMFNKEWKLMMRIIRLLNTSNVTFENLDKGSFYSTLKNISIFDPPPEIKKLCYDIYETSVKESWQPSTCISAKTNPTNSPKIMSNTEIIDKSLKKPDVSNESPTHKEFQQYKDANDILKFIQLRSLDGIGKIPRKTTTRLQQYKDGIEILKCIQLPSLDGIGKIPRKTKKNDSNEDQESPFEDLSACLQEDANAPKNLSTSPVTIPFYNVDDINIQIGPWPEPKGYYTPKKRHLVDGENSVPKKKVEYQLDD